MKLLLLFVNVLLFINFTAQKTLTTTQLKSIHSEKSLDQNIQISTFKVNEEKLATKNTTPSKTINYYNDYITAIETKIAYMQSNPEENEKAIVSGWYKTMNTYLLTAKKERELLKK